MSVPKTLTVIILTYNIKELTRDCLRSVFEASKKLTENGYDMDVIVSDNASSDGTPEMVKEEFPSVKLIQNENIGFARGNNAARPYTNSEYILILNPDTYVEENTLIESVKYMEERKDVAAMTCKLVLPNGKLDKDVRRSFITPWIAFSHFWFFDRIFPKNKFFSRYWYTYVPEDTEHEVDVIQGAYCFIRKKVMDEVNWYDEDYFLDGEDIDLCWKIKQRGYKIMYYPKIKTIHYKGATKGKANEAAKKMKVSKLTKIKAVMAGTNAMKIFYDKHLVHKYPWVLNKMVYLAMWLLKMQRIVFILIKGSR